MRGMLASGVVVAWMGAAVACSSGPAGGTSGCKDNAGCPGGQACISGTCSALCRVDADCGSGKICTGDVCAPGARKNGPTIASIDGDGSAQPVVSSQAGQGTDHRLRNQITVGGTNLQGASLALNGAGGAQFDLLVDSSSDTQVVATVPDAITAGQYALTATNAAGSDQTTVWLLQGEQGPPGTYVAGDGIVLNGDTLGADFGTGAKQVASGADLAALQATVSALQDQVNQQATTLDNLMNDTFGALHYPQVLTPNHALAIASGPGVLTYLGGDDVIMQGQRITLPGFTFNPVAGKTYHVRYTVADGWSLDDLADTAYNPNGLAEADPSFDTTPSDMLVARVVTDASNNPTVTLLHNADRLAYTFTGSTGCPQGESLPAQDGVLRPVATPGSKLVGDGDSSQRELSYTSSKYFTSREILTLNWARRPRAVSFSHDMGYFANNVGNRQFSELISRQDRYGVVLDSEWVLSNPAACTDLSVVSSGTD